MGENTFQNTCFFHFSSQLDISFLLIVTASAKHPVFLHLLFILFRWKNSVVLTLKQNQRRTHKARKNPLMPVIILKYATKSFKIDLKYSFLTWLLPKDTVVGNVNEAGQFKLKKFLLWELFTLSFSEMLFKHNLIKLCLKRVTCN